MLIRAGNDRPFPQNDLTYLAFRLTACQTFLRIEGARHGASLGCTDADDAILAYLEEVPLLAEVPVDIQMNLLGEVWMRHNAARVYRATLLDAAILYAVCREGAEVIQAHPILARELLEDAPRQFDVRLDRWTVNRLLKIYSRWWQSFNPGRLQSTVEIMDFLPRLASPLEDALDRTEVSPGWDRNFTGLLTDAEINDQFHLLRWAEQHRRRGEQQ